jgi:hypothetical protein
MHAIHLNANARFRFTYSFLPLLLSLGCAGAGLDSTDVPDGVGKVEQAVTDPLSVCNQDPRVNSGLVPAAVCAGARVFFNETFGGNGRTCGTCHSAANNFTLDAAFVASLPSSDPLFVNENTAFDLSTLESSAALRSSEALIRENVDGFDDVDHKFVARAVPHTLSLATSIARDPADLTSASVVQRTGWGGDGAPGDGSLRNFIDGAIKQHYTTTKNRTPGSFRLATETEKDQVLAFQLALGRTSDINLSQVAFADAGATAGKAAFIDPMVGRCNECHSNAGANSLVSGKNRNFDTGTNRLPPDFGFGSLASGAVMLDGGFGGQTATSPNFSTGLQGPIMDAFGDGTFNVPPLIEAADTGPFFHSHASGTSIDPTSNIEAAVNFYASDNFLNSPAARLLDAKFGGPVNVRPSQELIARMLRVLNASFNLAIAKQRMDAARQLNIYYWAYRDDIQKGLLNLASKEISDAIGVLKNAAAGDLHIAQQSSLASARSLLGQAVAATDPAVRKARTESALTIVQAAKSALGTNMNFQLGTGNLMF